MLRWCLIAAGAALLGEASHAEQTACCRVPEGTAILLELAEAVGSAARVTGDVFAIKLAEPLLLDGQTVLPAGTPGQGQVVHAARARGAGRPGELILTARYLLHDGRKLPLRAYRTVSMTGKSNAGLATAGLLLAGPATFLVRGGDVALPAGTLATARLAAEISVPPLDALPSPTTQPTGELEP